MDQRVSAITVGVSDLARSRRFYVDGLGWQPVYDTENIVFFQLAGLVLALFPLASLAKDAQVSEADCGIGGIALCYNVRRREEVDQVIAAAVAAGARLLKPGQDAFWGGYSGYFADPDGHPWEVVWNPAWTLDEEGRVTFGV